MECTASDSSSKPAQPLKIDLIRKALASILSVDKREVRDASMQCTMRYTNDEMELFYHHIY